MTRRATLIYNAKAGRFHPSAARVLALLQDAGYDAAYRPTGGENDLAAALRDPGDLVVAAGGDGTIRGVALTLAQTRAETGSKVPLAVVPLGTANNIARTLGLAAPTADLVRGLAAPRKRPFDLGCVRAPWGDLRFLEAFGFGMFAQGLADYRPDAPKNLLRAAWAAARTLAHYEAKYWRLELDGEDVSGRYLMVETMNTAAMGLRLRLAPGADPGDGVFDVVLVREDKSVSANSYLTKLAAGHLQKLPNVTVRRGRHLKLDWDGPPVHIDEEIRGTRNATKSTGSIDVEIQPGALELWLPQQR